MSQDPTAEPITIIGAPKPEFPSLARRTHDRIRERIREFLDPKARDLDFLRDAARALDLLPLSPASRDRWYGVRPDGDLLSFSPRTPYEVLEEEDQWRRAAELLRASERYPELEALVPPPPLSCRTCPRCGGSGLIRREGRDLTCICEGLGWIAPVEDEIEEGKEDMPKKGK